MVLHFFKRAAEFRRATLALLLILTAQIIWADNMAYLESSTGQFGTIDLNTGAFTYLGSNGLNAAGLALFNGTLYATSDGGTSIYSVNTSNGALTQLFPGNDPVEFAM